MITVLLEKIIAILEGWIQSFTSHAQHVEDKLDSLDQTASDIETNTEPISDIKDNTGAVITPIQNIKTNTDSIATSSQTSANNTTAILNNIGTLSTNTGRAAAYAQDCANNTLDIKDKVTTIASDTTNIRATDNNIYGAVNDIKDLLQYYFLTNIVTEEAEGVLCNFDTDLEDYLQKAAVTIPADVNGISALDIIICGANLWDEQWEAGTYDQTTGAQTPSITLKRNKTPIKVLPNTSYARVKTQEGSLLACRMFYYDEDMTLISTDVSTSNLLTITTPNNCAYVNFSFQNNITALSFNYPASATEVNEYQDREFNILFNSPITDGAEIDLLSGMVTINTTPVTYDSITPIAIRTFKGINNIYSDIGSMNVIYRETLKHYLDKNNQ